MKLVPLIRRVFSFAGRELHSSPIHTAYSGRPQLAVGGPGIEPRWTTSRKDGVGTARERSSRVWFAISRGIVGEVYYPRIDRAAVKEMGMVVTDGNDFFSDERSDTHSEVSWLESGVPGFRLQNVCRQGRYAIEKSVVTDPWRNVLLQQTKFRATQESTAGYQFYVVLAPHLGDKGRGNSARLFDYKGIPMLAAECDGVALALSCSLPWKRRTVGFMGRSDGWQELREHRRLRHEYEIAEHGNVALTGEIDISQSTDFLLAVGFGRNASEAGHRARASLQAGFETCCGEYAREWVAWQTSLDVISTASYEDAAALRIDKAVLATHESKDFPGGVIASLSLPWGEIHGDNDIGGYHLAWNRDAYESGSALLAAGARDEVKRALDFFVVTQEADGHWPQNMWLDGTEFGKHIQLDEIAAPILLFDLANRNGVLAANDGRRLWPMLRQAANYMATHGPSTPQDRWEEEGGLTPYTIATTIAALLIAAEQADANREPAIAAQFRSIADAWNASIEQWLYFTDTELARKLGVDGYYVRLVPASRADSTMPAGDERIKIPNAPGGAAWYPASAIVCVDALALVRFGLRAADDPRIMSTVRVIDAVLKVETPSGPCWRRYSHDGYGEHEDGSPFDGTGIGRAWPLFTGERAHFELAAGRETAARSLLQGMQAMAGDTGLLPEQIWDAVAIPHMDLYPGRPSGSARPLVWAHAEHLKLMRSLQDGRVFDMPPQTVSRYLKGEDKDAGISHD